MKSREGLEGTTMKCLLSYSSFQEKCKKKSFFFELVLVQLAEYGLINSCFKHDRKYKIKTNDLFAGQTH